MNPKKLQRKERFKRIEEAIQSVYREASWRDRLGEHDFEMHFMVADDKQLTSRAAGGPTLKSLQLDRGVHHIRQLDKILDDLTELQRIELSDLKNRNRQ